MSDHFLQRARRLVTCAGLALACGCSSPTNLAGRFSLPWRDETPVAKRESRFSLPWQSHASVRSHGQGRPAQAASPSKAPAASAVVTEQNQAQIQLVLAETFEKQGDAKAATAAYEAALRNDASLARAYHRLALLKERTGATDESKELLTKAMELEADNAEIACDLGYWYYLRRDWKLAQQHLQHALTLDPSLERAHNNLGLVLARAGQPDAAVTHFSAAGLSEAEMRTNLGIVFMTEGRLPEAESILEQAVATDRQSAKASNALAGLRRVKQQDQALNEPQPRPHSDAPFENIHDQRDAASRADAIIRPSQTPSDNALSAHSDTSLSSEVVRVQFVDDRSVEGSASIGDAPVHRSPIRRLYADSCAGGSRGEALPSRLTICAGDEIVVTDQPADGAER